MRRAFAFAVLLLLLIPYSSAFAQSRTTIEARVVTTCGTISPTYNAGPPNLVTIDVNGTLCVNASVSASITGFPTTQSTGTPISVTTGGVSGTLPTGTVVVASNVGATNGAYCKLGASATTSDQLIPPNSWFAFTVGAATQLTCITSTSTTTVNMVGGSGLPTGSGGGGGGGSGGAVTIASAAVASGAYASGSIASGAYASGAFASGAAASGSWADGAIVTLGAKADAKSTATDTTSITVMQVNKEISFALQNPITASATNPTGTLALPATTTAYTAGNLICTSATVATCNTALASETITIANSAGAVVIPRLRLTTNDATGTAWGGQTVQIDLWSAAPTFATTGDRASFVTDFSTGSAGHLAAFTCVMSAEVADGAWSECTPNFGNYATIKLASGTSIFWTAIAATGSGVTGASKTFTLTAEASN